MMIWLIEFYLKEILNQVGLSKVENTKKNYSATTLLTSNDEGWPNPIIGNNRGK